MKKAKLNKHERPSRIGLLWMRVVDLKPLSTQVFSLPAEAFTAPEPIDPKKQSNDPKKG